MEDCRIDTSFGDEPAVARIASASEMLSIEMARVDGDDEMRLNASGTKRPKCHVGGDDQGAMLERSEFLELGVERGTSADDDGRNAAK